MRRGFPACARWQGTRADTAFFLSSEPRDSSEPSRLALREGHTRWDTSRAAKAGPPRELPRHPQRFLGPVAVTAVIQLALRPRLGSVGCLRRCEEHPFLETPRAHRLPGGSVTGLPVPCGPEGRAQLCSPFALLRSPYL